MVSVNKNNTINVLDIGARYGIHPSWKNFSGKANYHLIEADKTEAGRLKKKYKKFKNIFIYNKALGKDRDNLYFNVLHNPAMSGFLERRNISPLFWGERKVQEQIKSVKKIKTISLNAFTKENNVKVDFLKLDVEGLEPTILNHGHNIFNNLLAARSEVNFCNIFKLDKKKTGSFSLIHEIFTNHDFILLNIDYQGKGDYFHKFLSSNQRFGVLQNADAVWIKDPKIVVKKFNEIQVLKILVFLILNNGIDLAMWILESTFKKFSNFRKNKNNHNFIFIKNEICKHLYNLKWIPNQKIKEHKNYYEKIFNENYPDMNKFNEMKEFNPY
jgi:FkbM family methyltransferase